MKQAILALSLILSFNLAFAETPEEKGLAITKKVDAANTGYGTETSKMEMILINAHGDKTTRKMKMKTKETSNDGDKSLSEFEWPADVNGTKMLTWTHKKEDDDQWLYLPSIKRVKRISSKDRSGSFMGSEFSYEDLGSQEVEKYTYKFIKDETIDGKPHWVVERVPVGKSGYSKQISWINQEVMNPTKIEYYDRKGDLLKTATFKDYKKFGKFWRIGGIEMVNHQTKKQSALTWSDRQLGQSISDSSFESAALEN